MATMQDLINDRNAKLGAKTLADAAAVAADTADGLSESALLTALVQTGPTGDLAADGNSVTVYAAVGSPPVLTPTVIPIASTVAAPSAPAPAPATTTTTPTATS